ncbi:Pantoate--beta-alanine ligase [[Candida] zeylanoides]
MTAPQILRTVQQVRQWRLQRLLARESVGFVPTMGALHAGHCSLIAQSLADNDHTVVSIFVNPSQFAPHEDLDAYPRTLDSDVATLSGLGPGGGGGAARVSAIFVPRVSEMYPSGIPLDPKRQRGAFVTVHGSSEQLEGGSRPQFFRGVATVVTKLLNVVTPDRVYFGQKDAQQCVVVRNLVKDLLIDTSVEVLPTLREPNGLAMSSRNAYLAPATRARSGAIYAALEAGERAYRSGVRDSAAIVATIRAALEGFDVEYLCISHPDTLEDVAEVRPGEGAIVSTAVRMPNAAGSQTRLIDNIVLK